MLNAEIRMLEAPDGTPVTNASFDLSHQQLDAAALACAAVRRERHHAPALETDEVLALRELTSLCDELEHLAGDGGHATVVMPLARLAALHDALDHWVERRAEEEKLPQSETAAFPLVSALLGPLASVREDGVRAALGAADHTV
jgi:hypothetical protein